MFNEGRIEGGGMMAGRKHVVKLTQRTIRLYQKITGNKEVRCKVCGKMLYVGDRVVKHGKLREPEKKGHMGCLFFYCEECWGKMYLDLPDVSEEEVERGEVLTVPFLNL